MIKDQFAVFKGNIDTIQIESVFIHKVGKALYGIHACTKPIEQEALCCRGRSRKQSQANLLGALDMSVDMKCYGNF